MSINEHTLISKLSFVVYGDASAESLHSLQEEFQKTSKNLVPKRTAHPSENQIEQWFQGRPIDKLSHYKFFEFLIEEMFSQVDRYPRLTPERKKVFHQINKLLKRRIESTENLDPTVYQAHDKWTNKNYIRLLDIKLVSAGLLEQLRAVEDELEEERPNSDDALLIRNKSLELIEITRQSLLIMDKSISASLNIESAASGVLDENMLHTISEEFRSWMLANKPEIVDVVMRLTPATAFLGLLGLAGANMAWATPVVLAMCGGSKIVEVLKNIKN